MASYAIGPHRYEAAALKPGLYITATPIGNLGDITLRALATLAAADAILCEDTRQTARLLERYGIRTPTLPYHDHNAERVRPRMLERLAGGAALAQVSDAGMPLISDPGFKLAEAAIAAGRHVEVIPGATAVTTALALSCLPSDRFHFGGFLPQKAGDKRRRLEELRGLQASLIFFESPNRIVESLQAIGEVMGDRLLSVSRELTKLYEETLRGSAPQVAATLAARPSIKGEITLVIGPPTAHAVLSEEEVERQLLEAIASLPAGKAAAEVARVTGLPKQELYQRLLRLKSERD
jgi:16S rRNA (cytidine1402-2'-O)-methyltransferase